MPTKGNSTYDLHCMYQWSVVECVLSSVLRVCVCPCSVWRPFYAWRIRPAARVRLLLTAARPPPTIGTGLAQIPLFVRRHRRLVCGRHPYGGRCAATAAPARQQSSQPWLYKLYKIFLTSLSFLWQTKNCNLRGWTVIHM